jgi:hypothetical protein
VPTVDLTVRFRREFARLSPEQKAAFRAALRRFVEDLRRGQLRPGLRVSGLHSRPGVYEMTWAPGGRATFEYGEAIHAGEPHIIWRRCGTHQVLVEP